ncbi:4-(cytidine 5'-diphospho)-2-C-methyl-D-erythritol kinase [Erysipelothrix urinaevulpis]|uniref:4-(cytidine 5'-diphospho)-2-C-methyl-D-erythritol kinase n=1 Tax=Erysipelothrix urinaevulpis TaxID=2683717 RepID=UPI00135CC8B9|nr:4-(cytidine 5'-diphospho)-2-C-methyl-D-erythritol kinase [Erysipelothrix urinaevulpis]
MRRKAYAKISLFLQVVGREDGKLHFRNILYPIDLFDMVYLDVSDELRIESNKTYLPNDKRNTVFKAVKLMKKRYKIKENFHIRIVKNIPAQSGLGGGSADAAAVIQMLNEKYDLQLSHEELISIGREIDEDTPFCLFNRPAIVEKEGSELTFIDTEISMYYLLIKPKYGISTKRFMKGFHIFSDDDEKFEQCYDALLTNDYNRFVNTTHNDFQKSVGKRNRNINRLVKKMNDYGLEGVCMTGSGTAVYGFSQDLDLVLKIHKDLALKYPFVKYGKI